MGISACILTGCDSENYFGAATDYIMAFGEDMFGTGDIGIFGGKEVTEPEANEESEIFHDFNIKSVEKSAKNEKVAYNYSGPENEGISTSSQPVTSIGSTQEGKGLAAGESVLITSEYSDAPTDKLMLLSKQSYYDLAKEWFSKLGKGKVSDSSRKFYDDLYALAHQGTASDDNCLKTAVSYGLLVRKGKGYSCAADDSSKLDFYRKFNKKLDKLVSDINKTIDDPAAVKGNSVAKAAKSSEAFYYAACHNDTSDVYEPTYNIAFSLCKKLSGNGYPSTLGKSNASEKKLADGSALTYKNIALYGNTEKPVVHFVLSWDMLSNADVLKFQYRSGDAKSAAIAKAMVDALGGGLKKDSGNSEADALLNWTSVPTVIVKLGGIKGSAYTDYLKGDKFDSESFVNDRYEVFKVGVDAAVS